MDKEITVVDTSGYSWPISPAVEDIYFEDKDQSYNILQFSA